MKNREKKSGVPEKRKIAVFDIDGTIFRSSLLIELVNELVATVKFPYCTKYEMEESHLRWRNRQGTYGDFVDNVVSVFLKNIVGRNKNEIDKIICSVVDYHKDRVHRYTRELIEYLKQENYFLLAISGSPLDIVSVFTKYLGFDEAYGNVFEVENGKYTGCKEDIAKDKSKVLDVFFKKHKNMFDMSKSIAVGDTDGDIPLLKRVECPIAFNPNKVLADYAKKNGWTMVVERKDVIYKLSEYKFLNLDIISTDDIFSH